MNNFNAENVEQLGYLQFLPEQIAVIEELNPEAVMNAMGNPDSEFYKAYMKGYYKAEILVRNSIMKLAGAGSSPAQAMALKLIDFNKSALQNG
jgi:hypothetical protein